MTYRSTLAAVATLALVASSAAAQSQAEKDHAAQMAAAARGEAKAMVAGKAISIDYGRPELKGRDMLGQAKPGTPWRMGKDAATTLVTDADLTFGAAALPKGRYTLTAVKGDKEDWTMVATSVADKKATNIPLTMSTNKASVEMFTINLTGKDNAGELVLMWGAAKMSAAFTGK